MTLDDQQFKKWLRRPTEFIANAWYLLASAGQYVLGYAVMYLAQLLAMFGIGLNGEALTVIASSLSQLLLFMLPVVVYTVTHDGVEQSMRLNLPRPAPLILSVFAAPLGVMFSDKLSTWWMLLLESLGGTLHASGIPVPTTPDQLIYSLLLFAVLPGACEELFFRGGLMGAWERRGTRQALVITSVLFALLHGSVAGFPVQLMMGFVLGYLVVLSDSLFVGMAYHITHNAVTMLLAYLSREITVDPYADLAGYIHLTGGFPALTAQTIVWALLYGGVLTALFILLRKQGGQIDRIADGDKEPMTWETLIVLLAGLLTVGVTFMSDLLTVCGVL